VWDAWAADRPGTVQERRYAVGSRPGHPDRWGHRDRQDGDRRWDGPAEYQCWPERCPQAAEEEAAEPCTPDAVRFAASPCGVAAGRDEPAEPAESDGCACRRACGRQCAQALPAQRRRPAQRQPELRELPGPEFQQPERIRQRQPGRRAQPAWPELQQPQRELAEPPPRAFRPPERARQREQPAWPPPRAASRLRTLPWALAAEPQPLRAYPLRAAWLRPPRAAEPQPPRDAWARQRRPRDVPQRWPPAGARQWQADAQWAAQGGAAAQSCAAPGAPQAERRQQSESAVRQGARGVGETLQLPGAAAEDADVQPLPLPSSWPEWPSEHRRAWRYGKDRSWEQFPVQAEQHHRRARRHARSAGSKPAPSPPRPLPANWNGSCRSPDPALPIRQESVCS